MSTDPRRYLREPCPAVREGGGPDDRAVYNAPGKSSIDYRIDTQPGFLARMLDALRGLALPDGPFAGERPLAALEAALDDPAAAYLDAAAMAADVLTFYQERIANEGYLGTAVERRSVLELARLVGVELGPGVGAGVELAFRVESAPGSPESAVVPRGTRVLSVPGQGELPQTFETQEEIVARAAWNDMPALTREPQTLAGARELFLVGVATGLAAGDRLLFIASNPAFGGEEWTLARVLRAEVEDEEQRTRVELASPLPAFADRGDLEVYAFSEDGRFFGHNAQAYGSLPSGEYLKDDPYPTADPAADWDTGRTVWTDSRGTAYRVGAGSAAGGEAGADDPAAEAAETAHVYLDRKVDELVPGGWAVVLGPTLATGSRRSEPAAALYRVSAVTETTRIDYALSQEVTGLVFADVEPELIDRPGFELRAARIWVGSTPLAVAMQPITDPFPDDERDAAGRSLILDREVGGLRPGQRLALSGRTLGSGDDAPPVHRIVTLRSTRSDGAGHTQLFFQPAVTGVSLDRSSLRVSGNLAPANHGESVEEVLGSGDGAKPNQSFSLRRAPLTYEAAPVPGGAAASLEVRVDGVLWREVPSLYGEGPEARVYTVRVDEEGRGIVSFGDGDDGARLPTGEENVTARYRVGVGLDGLVPAGALSLLLTRPLGIAEVTNPLPASGAAAPDTPAQARRRAPLHARTLGGIVSAADFEDFARSFAGIAKVRSAPLGGVHLTVAGVGGAPVDPGTELYDSLFAALSAARLPGPPLTLQSYRPLPVQAAAALVIDPLYQSSDVLDRARSALALAFSFDRRELGRPLYASEIVEVLEGVAGVAAVDLDALYVEGRPPALASRLAARPARLFGAGTAAAELLFLAPDGITLGARTP